jgi:MtN3 and saliva related transmembrane protein
MTHTPFLVLSRTDCLGYIAAMLTTIAFAPQAWLTWKTRATEGISTPMYLMFSSGVLLWGIYGLMIHSWPVMIANVLTLAQALLILSLKLGVFPFALRPAPAR